MMSDVKPNAIEIRDVQKSFGITKVIRDLNLKVAQGERHALIGPERRPASRQRSISSAAIWRRPAAKS